MKLVFIFGAPAVGKMTVGQELAKITGLKLYHNHMTMDLVSEFFDIWTTDEGKRLNSIFCEEICKAVAKSKLKGMIYTCVRIFDREPVFMNRIRDIFVAVGADIYNIELNADDAVRIERNKTPNRLFHKPSKRDVEKTEKGLLEGVKHERYKSYEGEIADNNYMRINNTHIPPVEAAKMIKNNFSL